MTDKLKKELPEMLTEHKRIVAALEILISDAKTENLQEVAAFAEKLCCTHKQKRKFHTQGQF